MFLVAIKKASVKTPTEERTLKNKPALKNRLATGFELILLRSRQYLTANAYPVNNEIDEKNIDGNAYPINGNVNNIP